MRTINIPTSHGDIVVDLADGPNGKGGAVAMPPCFESPAYDDILNTVTTMILAHACAGVDVGSAAYAEGVNVALESLA